MKFYFSGISGTEEYRLLKSVQSPISPSIMVDPTDLKRILQGWTGSVAIDCGAYRAKKADKDLDPEAYLKCLQEAGQSDLLIDFAIALDHLDDPEQTQRWWVETSHWNEILPFPYIPVWQWGTDESFLKDYLNECAIVAVGRLVPLMRAKDELMLKRLTKLAQAYPVRLHILGCNWLKAIEVLAPVVYSVDTSKSWDAWRYGSVVFWNRRSKHLAAAPYKVIPEFAHLTDRHERARECVRTFSWFALAQRLLRQEKIQCDFLKVPDRKEWMIHKGGNWATGGMVGQLTKLSIGGEICYVRENILKTKTSFEMSANERLQWKRGFVPRPEQQMLELCAPKQKWMQAAQAVHLQEADDALWSALNHHEGTFAYLKPGRARHIYKNARFSRRWAEAQWALDGAYLPPMKQAA